MTNNKETLEDKFKGQENNLMQDLRRYHLTCLTHINIPEIKAACDIYKAEIIEKYSLKNEYTFKTLLNVYREVERNAHLQDYREEREHYNNLLIRVGRKHE